MIAPATTCGREDLASIGRMFMGGRLDGRAALVIGAGSSGPGWGNGKATAVLMAREGARVACADINAEAAEETRALIESEVPPKLASILNIIEDITAIPSGDPALLRCLASVIAPCAMLLVVGRNVSPVADEIRGMPTEDLVEHLYGFALGGLEAVGHHRSRPEIEK